MPPFSRFSNLSYRTKPIPQGVAIYDLFRRAYAQEDTVVYLESLGEYGEFSRYTILYFDPVMHLVARNGELTIDGKKVATDNPYQTLRALNDLAVEAPGYCGGLFGYLSYEGTRYLDDIPGLKTNGPFPDFEFGLFLDGVVYDKQTGQTHYFYLDQDRSDRIDRWIKNNIDLPAFSFAESGANLDEKEYRRHFDRCKEHIAWGDVFQVILSVQYHYQLSGSPFWVYDSLRQINPSPYLSYIKFGERELITSSVDLVTRVRRAENNPQQRIIENFALAGTTLRGQSPEEDDQLFDEMVGDIKERAEHMMLVDLSRNDVGRVAEFGSVQVAELMVPKRFSHVQHIESKITGTLRNDKDAFDALQATAPMGTVTGAPKIEAMKIINALEPDARGPYSGCLGGFGLNGECIFSVGVRSLFIAGKTAYTQVGSGLVYDSTPDYEYRELLRKRRSILAAMQAAMENGAS